MDPQQYENKMSLDTQTGRYEGEIRIKVTVDAEFVRREMNRIISESPGLDLMDAKALESIRAKLADPFYWKDKPQAKVDTITITSPSPMKQEEVPKQTKASLAPPSGLTKKEHMRKELEEKARHVAPYRWLDDVQTPLPPLGLPKLERQPTHNLRWEERQILASLLEEWKQGTFVLDPEAEEEEKRYQATQTEHLETTIKEVALASNGNRFH